mgnify:CR=1 FL=1
MNFKIVVDSREQAPWAFRCETVRKALPAGDCSVEGLETKIAVERKSLTDFVHTVIHDRERFGRELLLLSTYDAACVVVEADLDLVRECAQMQRLPVVNFAAGGVATPADAALMMQLGADGVFVGSGIFKSESPEAMARAIVEAVHHYDDPAHLAKVSKGLGAAMKGLDAASIPEAEALVRFLGDTCDIVIVSFHGGAEGAEYQHVTRKEEMSFGESRGNVYDFSHRMIDAGADIVFGHGPHVTRAIEVYRDRFIAYSLGNFCTYGRFNLSGPNGIAPIIKLNVDTAGKFISGRIIPVYQLYFGGVKVDPEKKVIKKIKELTAQDFPESVINISDDGEITFN